MVTENSSFLDARPTRQPFQPSPTPSPASHQETFQNDEKLVEFGVAQAARPLEARAPSPGGPGPKPWRPRPQALGPKLDFLRAVPLKNIVPVIVRRPWGALTGEFSERRKIIVLSPHGPGPPSPLRARPQAFEGPWRWTQPKPGQLRQPGLLRRLISCAQSWQPSLN